MMNGKQRAFGNVVVASFAHGNSLVEIVAAEKRLPQFADISFALQLNAELFADGAGAAVASDQIGGPNRFFRGVASAWTTSGHGVRVLRE